MDEKKGKSRLPSWVRSVPASLMFLSRIPIPGDFGREDWEWAPAHFPFAGAVLGALTALVFLLLMPVGPWPAAFLALGAYMLLSGCFHEDGLADSADALGGAYNVERTLEILKDSRIGSFGTAALVVGICARAGLLVRLGPDPFWPVVVTFAVARIGPVWMMGLLPYAGDSPASKTRDLTGSRMSQAWVSLIWGVLICGLAAILGGLTWGRLTLLLVFCGATCLLASRYFMGRVGGYTGDFLGATEQVCEVVGLCVFAWR